MQEAQWKNLRGTTCLCWTPAGFPPENVCEPRRGECVSMLRLELSYKHSVTLTLRFYWSRGFKLSILLHLNESVGKFMCRVYFYVCKEENQTRNRFNFHFLSLSAMSSFFMGKLNLSGGGSGNAADGTRVSRCYLESCSHRTPTSGPNTNTSSSRRNVPSSDN